MVIEAQRVSYRRGGLALVRHVSVAVGGGELLAVVGTRGSGAGTLWRLLAGELAPSAGRVLVRGRDRPGLRADPRVVAHGPDATRALLRSTAGAEVLLCDQPALGPEGPELLDGCRARAEAGAAVVVTVDDVELAARYAHTVAVLEAGRLARWASPSFLLHAGVGR